MFRLKMKDLLNILIHLYKFILNKKKYLIHPLFVYNLLIVIAQIYKC